MTSSKKSLRGATLASALIFTALTGCDGMTSGAPTADGAAVAPALDPILASPQVGDLYAAELSAFSSAAFSDGNSEGAELSKAYGMLKVVAVNDSTVTVITENGAWAESAGAIEELGGDLSTISWDESEQIPIQRAQLAQFLADGKILRTRRLEAAAAAPAAGVAPPAATAEAAPTGEGKPGAGK